MTEVNGLSVASSRARSWWIYRGTGAAAEPGNGPVTIPDPPPWRRFEGRDPLPAPEDDGAEYARRLGGAATAARSADELDVINSALLLRRPLLVTGPTGVGKSSLAYLVARELGLGPVLRWGITSRSTLKSGLYEYDAIGRAQAIAAWRAADARGGSEAEAQTAAESARLGNFVHLGPLGTALLPHQRPRVLLIDELDKSDIDLPNDLLHVLENGGYTVPELARAAEREALVFTQDAGRRYPVCEGTVQCAEFPFVIITSNGERDFPSPFLRRCLRLEMHPPTVAQLADLVAAHLRQRVPEATDLIMDYVERVERRQVIAVDQLLNAVHMATSGGYRPDEDGRALLDHLLRDLTEGS